MQGVYKIENINNGKKYIGSSKDIEKRFYQHKQELKNKTHHSVKLQRAWSKANNKDIFLFDVVEVVDDISALKEREQYYIDLFNAYHGGYNCSLKVDNPRYAKKNLDKKKKASMIPVLQNEFNDLYTPDKFYLRGWSSRKFANGLYSYSSYNFILICMKWFLSTYPEPYYKLQIGTHLNKTHMWVHYNNVDFAIYKYDKGKVFLDKDSTNETIARLKYNGSYDEAHHQVRGDILIHVVDAKMGAGKSSALINLINNSKNDVRFIYVTPYLKEVERIIEKCPDKNFKQPFINEEFKYSKLRGLKILLGQQQNVVTTHALFHYFDDEIIDLVYNGNYVLILDEVVDVIVPYLKENSKSKKQGITRSDLDDLLKCHAKMNEKTGFVEWTDASYDGNQNEYKILCDLNSLALYGSEKYPLWLFPIRIFKAFRESYVLTYMFNAQPQRYYYDMHKIQYDYKGVEFVNGDYYITNNLNDVPYVDYRKLIHICEKEKLNRIGGKQTDLSKSWYTRNKNNPLMIQLKNNTINFFKNICGCKSSDCIWTTFKSQRQNIQGKGYTKGFLSCNMRATNEYRDRNCVAYLMNRYMNPIVKNFFLQHGVNVDEDGYALSEMLQFIWRSAIRDGKEIWVYIPSIRMRTLLKQWIKENSPKTGVYGGVIVINKDNLRK